MSFPGLPYLSLPGLTASSTPCDYPVEDDVRDGVVYAFTTMTGNLVVPDEDDVLLGVGFGSNGTEFTGTLIAGGPPAPVVDQSQASPFAAICNATRLRVGLALGIDPAFVLLAASDNYRITIVEPLFVVIRPYQPEPNPDGGAGRLSRDIRRRMRFYIYTRSGEDVYGNDTIALESNTPSQTVATPPTLPGHFVAEEMLLNALDDWAPLAADGTDLVIGVLHPMDSSNGPPERAPEADEGLIRSCLDFECLYVAAIDPTDPAE